MTKWQKRALVAVGFRVIQTGRDRKEETHEEREEDGGRDQRDERRPPQT